MHGGKSNTHKAQCKILGLHAKEKLCLTQVATRTSGLLLSSHSPEMGEISATPHSKSQRFSWCLAFFGMI